MLARDARSLFCAALFGVSALALLAPPSALAQGDGGAPAPRVLFLMPDLGPSVREPLEDALAAQMSLVDAELVMRDDSGDRDARELARAERARIVLWLDASSDGRWLLHIVDVEQERAVVRRIDGREAQRGAAIEAIAVLAREASRGGPLPEETEKNDATATGDPAPAETETPAEPEPSPEPASPPPAEPPAPRLPPRLRLALFYSGVDFAPETSFSHGAGLAVRLDWSEGFFAGLHAGWTALAEPPGNLAVQRIPLGAAIGYRIRLLPDLWADLELGLLIELLDRSTRGEGANQADSLRIAAGVSPRLRGEYKPLEFIGFFAGFGLDVAFTTLRYYAQTDRDRRLLTPSWVRPEIEAGVAIYP